MTDSAAPSISVIIVSWHSGDALPSCLRSLRAAACSWPGAVEVVIVDNAPQDGCAARLHEEFTEITVLPQESNLGFPRACNVGLAACGGDFVLLLNPDVQIAPDTFEACVGRLQADPSAGVVGVRLIDALGRTQPECARRFPNEWWLLCEALYLHRLAPGTRLFGGLNFGEWDHLEEREVPCLLGAFLFFRGACLRELGGLDESIFMYYEDIDVCKRAWSAGWRVLYLPEPAALHDAGSSRAKADELDSTGLDALKGEVARRFIASHGPPAWRASLITALVALYASIRILLLPAIVLGGRRSRTASQVLRSNMLLLAWVFKAKGGSRCA